MQKKFRMYVPVSENCKLCKPTLKVLGDSLAGVNIYPIWIEKNSTRAKQLDVKFTPHIAIVELSDPNGNGIYEEMEESEPVFTLQANITESRRLFLIDILNDLKTEKGIKTKIDVK